MLKQRLNRNNTMNKIHFFILLIHSVNFINGKQTETEGTPTPESFSSTVTNDDDTTERKNYCKELLPFCSCYLSPIIMKCENFERFSQLNFTKVNQSNNQFFELELFPAKSLVLNDDLDITGIQLIKAVKLRNINGFDFLQNPFRNNVIQKLSLSVYDSHIGTVNLASNCRLDLIPSSFKPLFSSFETIFFGNNLIYKHNMLCPLIFKNSNIKLIEIYYMNSSNILQFAELADNDSVENFASIESLRVFDARELMMNNKFLNRHVFSQLRNLDIDYSNFEGVDNDTFFSLYSLRRISFNIENFSEFIRSSGNEWMSGLNSGIIIVDYNDTKLLEEIRNHSVLVTFDTRYGRERYEFPNSDLIYFKYFPHSQFVFAKILSAINLNCTRTIEFLLQNNKYYKPLAEISTSLSKKCFYEPENASETTLDKTDIYETTIITTTLSEKEEEQVEKKIYTEEEFLAVAISLSALSMILTVVLVYFVIKYKKANVPQKSRQDKNKKDINMNKLHHDDILYF